MIIFAEVVARSRREVKTSARSAVARLRLVPRTLALLAVAPGGCDDPRAARAEERTTPPESPRAPAGVAPVTSAPVISAPAAASSAYEAEALARMDEIGETLEAQREALVDRLRQSGGVGEAEAGEILRILSSSKMTGQGNPEPTTHPMTRRTCFERRRAAGVRDPREPRCGAPYMVPVYDPARQTKDDATVCIDRYEFPGLPCEYPVTWVSTSQAQKICKVMGKRLCDAHEWEGACAGSLRDPKEEYSFGFPRAGSSNFHNGKRPITWAYGPTRDHAKCGTQSPKSPKCTASGWKECGSNTYPAGAFPECKSPLGVYDQHGNAAEHMLLPLEEKDLGSRGGAGVAEMKGSWFIFSIKEAHVDDCRWRAPP